MYPTEGNDPLQRSRLLSVLVFELLLCCFYLITQKPQCDFGIVVTEERVREIRPIFQSVHRCIDNNACRKQRVCTCAICTSRVNDLRVLGIRAACIVKRAGAGYSVDYNVFHVCLLCFFLSPHDLSCVYITSQKLVHSRAGPFFWLFVGVLCCVCDIEFPCSTDHGDSVCSQC